MDTFKVQHKEHSKISQSHCNSVLLVLILNVSTQSLTEHKVGNKVCNHLRIKLNITFLGSEFYKFNLKFSLILVYCSFIPDERGFWQHFLLTFSLYISVVPFYTLYCKWMEFVWLLIWEVCVSEPPYYSIYCLFFKTNYKYHDTQITEPSGKFPCKTNCKR